MSVRPSARFAAALIIPALLLGACGGSGTATTAPDGNAAVPSAGNAAPSDVALPSDLTLPSGLALPSFDLGSLATNLENVDSYRIAIVPGGSDGYTGTVITRPVVSRDLYIGTGDSATHIVTIGDESWLGQGTGPLQTAPSAMIAGLVPLFDPMTLVSAFANEGITQAADNLGKEDKNGQSTTHYKVDMSRLTGGLVSFPPGASMELWVADDGYLVSLVATDFGGTGSDLAIDVTNVNDPANVIERPS
jgi:hypothetical protein